MRGTLPSHLQPACCAGLIVLASLTVTLKRAFWIKPVAATLEFAIHQSYKPEVGTVQDTTGVECGNSVIFANWTAVNGEYLVRSQLMPHGCV